MDGIKNFQLTPTNRKSLKGMLDNLDVTVAWLVNVTQKKSKRSLDQNDRYWKLITAFGEFCGYDKDEMHQEVGTRFLTYEKTMPNGEIKKFIKSTTKLNVKEMVELQEHIERVANQQGFIFDETH